MTQQTTQQTRPALHPLLAERRSPRAFDARHALSPAQERALLEAARWAPSASNTQPWRFLVARRGEAAHDVLVAHLADGNRPWAPTASALVLVASAATTPWAAYDTGQAVAHLTVQAQAEGLVVHQIGGFDAAGVAGALGLPEGVVPLTLLAVGRHDPAAALPEALAAREAAPRERRPVQELLLDVDLAQRRAA